MNFRAKKSLSLLLKYLFYNIYASAIAVVHVYWYIIIFFLFGCGNIKVFSGHRRIQFYYGFFLIKCTHKAFVLDLFLSLGVFISFLSLFLLAKSTKSTKTNMKSLIRSTSSSLIHLTAHAHIYFAKARDRCAKKKH